MKSDNLTKLRQTLSIRKCISRADLCQILNVSQATVSRYIEQLRNQGIPIIYNKEYSGYQLTKEVYDEGFSLTSDEIHALLTMQRLLSHLEPSSLLAPHIEPLKKKLTQMLGTEQSAKEISRRVHIISLGARKLDSQNFQTIGGALLQRFQLEISYLSRGSEQLSVRVISPQRLVHYRDNWYLHAWCHVRKQLRTFALESISYVKVNNQPAKEIDENELDKVLGNGYGIFAGDKVRYAVLRFDQVRSRWVASESWHPKQSIHHLADGGIELTIPFSQMPELIMDILRHGAHVEVISPADLRLAVAEQLAQAAKLYG